MGTGGSSLPSSPLWLYIYVLSDVYIYKFNKSSKKINNYIALSFYEGISYQSSFLLKLVKIIDFLYECKDS